MLLDPIPLEEIKSAKKRISEDIIQTPLVRLNIDDSLSEIYLKTENLQPTRAYKLRAASNAIRSASEDLLENGVWTISSGNFAQALAWVARKLKIGCKILVPDTIPQDKEDTIIQFGAQVIKAPIEDAMNVLFTREYEGMEGYFVHPFYDPNVMAGSGTIGLEIIDDLADFDTIIIPWGGGGLSCGIASAIRALKEDVKIYASEIDTCTPLASSYKNDKIPDEIPYTPSFIDAIGYPFILPEMFSLAKKLLNGSLVVGLEETAKTISLLAKRNCIISEGAGALSVAAALSKDVGKKIVCIISGGNIDSLKLSKILKGEIP